MEKRINWYAIKANKIFKAEKCLEPFCAAVYLPKEKVKREGNKDTVVRAVIPKLMFIKTSETTAENLESRSQDPINRMEPFHIYRNIDRTHIQPIAEKEIELVKLLTADDQTRCEVYRKDNFQKGDYLRVTAGKFAGYEGYVCRIRKNKHVVVEIKGVCAMALPFIHPDLLEKISAPDKDSDR